MTFWEWVLVCVLGFIAVFFVYVVVETGMDFWR